MLLYQRIYYAHHSSSHPSRSRNSNSFAIDWLSSFLLLYPCSRAFSILSRLISLTSFLFSFPIIPPFHYSNIPIVVIRYALCVTNVADPEPSTSVFHSRFGFGNRFNPFGIIIDPLFPILQPARINISHLLIGVDDMGREF